MLIVCGRVKRVQSRVVPYTDKKTGEDTSFDEITVAIAAETDLNVSWCALGRDFGAVPEPGELIAAEASIRTYQSTQSRTGAGYQLTLWRRVGLAEAMGDSAAEVGSGARLAAVN